MLACEVAHERWELREGHGQQTLERLEAAGSGNRLLHRNCVYRLERLGFHTGAARSYLRSAGAFACTPRARAALASGELDLAPLCRKPCGDLIAMIALNFDDAVLRRAARATVPLERLADLLELARV